MPDPTGRISHLPDMHRGVAWKEPCRVATTASITISTALNAGDTIDGVTLAAGDRVLVKDQSTGSQNGIYIAGATPARAFDMDQDASTSVPASEVMGAIVYVIAGTANGGTLWKNTNTTAPTIGSTSLTFSQIASTGLSDPMTTRGDIIIRDSSNVTARLGKGAAGTILTSDGTDVAWGNGPMTTQDDLIVGGASGVPTRLGKGSDSQVLTVDPTTHHLVWATPTGGSGTITTKDEGSTLSSSVTTLDFVGAGVTASGSGATTTVTISGGGSGLTVQYPALKPGTPTYDFAGASLDAAFGAHSSQGSFGTGNCMTQGAHPWPGTTLEMQFSGQMGSLTLTHADTDLDFTWGGVSAGIGEGGNTIAVGIAALDSSGNGIIVVTETNDVYFGKAAAWNFNTVIASWGSGHGANTTTSLQTADFWFRLKRVSGTWTAYASKSGRAWDKTFPTDATSYTVATLNFGIHYNTGTAYSGRILSDYIQVDV